MACCSGCTRYAEAERQFGDAVAARDLERFRRKGPDATSRLLLKALRDHVVSASSLLDIGGGIGALDFELLANDVGSATLVDASPAYLDAAAREAESRKVADRLRCVAGDFAVLADYALIDQQGKLSILGIFQHVWVTAFPTVHPRTHLVLRVRGRRTEIGSHSIRIRFVDDTGKELMGGEGTVQFGEPPAGVTELEAGAVLVFDVPLPRPGQYAFEINMDGAAAARVPLTAAQVEQTQGFRH